LKKWFQKTLKQLELNESTLSMILGALVVVVVGVLIFNYFSKTGQQPVVVEEPEVLVEEPKQEGEVPSNLPTTHVVVMGENLWQIAEKYYDSGYNWVDIAEANGLANADVLLIGQELTIPQVAVRQPTVELKVQTGTEYTVQAGDHLWDIAVRAYGDGYKWVEIAQANNLDHPDYIEVGQVLTVPVLGK